MVKCYRLSLFVFVGLISFEVLLWIWALLICCSFSFFPEIYLYCHCIIEKIVIFSQQKKVYGFVQLADVSTIWRH